MGHRRMVTQEQPQSSVSSAGIASDLQPIHAGKTQVRPRRRTLQSFYRRAPWIGLPLDFLDRATTARHWLGAGDRVAGSRFLKPDSTRLAHALRGVMDPIGMATARLRARSPAFRRADWAMRRGFWSFLWAATVAYRYRPRRVWMPSKEKPIRMVPPSVRHLDFKADKLRFPDTVPLAEASFGSDLWVETLHLFQDIYPITVPHQDRASEEPEERLRQVYPWLFRLVRTPPRWHPDLVEAAAQDNLLGALAVGGPFAKLLECVDAEKASMRST